MQKTDNVSFVFFIFLHLINFKYTSLNSLYDFRNEKFSFDVNDINNNKKRLLILDNNLFIFDLMVIS